MDTPIIMSQALQPSHSFVQRPAFSLEIIIAKDITPLMSYQFFERFQREKRWRSEPAEDKREEKIQRTSLVQRGSAIINGKQARLDRYLASSDDINLVGVYGMDVDPQNQLWFSTNHLGIVHKLDEDFNLLDQYYPLDDDQIRPRIKNFRRIKFQGSDAYITDAKGALHIFGLPDCSYLRTVNLSPGKESSVYYPGELILHKGNIIIGCDYGGGYAGSNNRGELQDYRIQVVNPKDWSVRNIFLKGAWRMLEHSGSLYLISDERNRKNRKKTGKGDLFIAKLDEDFQPEEAKICRVPVYRETVVDRKGTLCTVATIYNRARDEYEPTFIAAKLEGEVFVEEKIPFWMNPICFDKENNLIGLVYGQSKLIAIKCRVEY